MPEPLKQYRMLFERIAQGDSAPKELGIRSKLGGMPDWIQQHDDTPECPGCNQSMTFIAQIDWIDFDGPHNPHRIDCLSKDKQYMFADVGMLYVFFCFDCLESATAFQC